MNFEFIEGRETRDKVVKFGGVGITDEEIVNNKGKCGGVGVVAEKQYPLHVPTRAFSMIADRSSPR
jgi:hypothetical protein